ncbi:MAG: ComEC/Rec2 family competence protein, partial [Candidatus Promineifilaceae bacterium]
ALACLAAAGFGAARLATSGPADDPGHVAAFNDGGEITLVGVVAAEPDRGPRSTGVQLRAESVLTAEGGLRPVHGRVQLTARPGADLDVGDRLQAHGRLLTPAAEPDFDYRAYLASQAIYSQLLFPQVTRLAADQAGPLAAGLNRLRDGAQATIERTLPQPQASLLAGILLGNDGGLPQALGDAFRATGLSHIVAISGFNIALLAGMLAAVARPVAGRRRAPWLALAGIGLYAVLVGAEAPVVRAAVMAGLYVVGRFGLGRPLFAPATLVVAAWFMTLANPRALWDAGFQLSFAATLGLMLCAAPGRRWLEARLAAAGLPMAARPALLSLGEILLTTLAAGLFTLPIILGLFGRLSLVSPLANLLVLPAQPGVLAWGGLAALAGLISPALAQPLAWVAWLFLSYTIFLAEALAALPWASAPLALSPAGALALYGLILGLTWRLLRRKPAATAAAPANRPGRGAWRPRLALSGSAL